MCRLAVGTASRTLIRPMTPSRWSPALTGQFGVMMLLVAILVQVAERSKNAESSIISSSDVVARLWPVGAIITGAILVQSFRRSRSFVFGNGCAAKSPSMSKLRTISTEAIHNLTSSLSRASVSSLRLLRTLSGARLDGRILSISGRISFLSDNDIAKLSVADIGQIFYYVQHAGRPSLHRREFLRSVSVDVALAVEQLDMAVLHSRGKNVAPPGLEADTASTPDAGIDIDALMLAAALRLFSDWRSQRMVPPGYTRYDYGMSMALRDLLQNIGKIEAAVHSLLAWQERAVLRESGNSSGRLTSPTVSDLIRHEIALRLHPRCPRVAEKSAASGLLWAKRQLHYQTAIFVNLTQVPLGFPTATAAVSAAYKLVYDRYHGFLVKRIFQSSLEAAPDAAVILEHMTPPGRDRWKASDTTSSDHDGEDMWTHVDIEPATVELTESSSAVSPLARNPIMEPFTRMHCVVAQCAGQHLRKHEELNAFASCRYMPLPQSLLPASDTNSVHADIQIFVDIVLPLINDLDRLIQTLNVDDPSRV